MKLRHLAAALLALVTASAAQAQSIYNNPDNRSYFGVRLSYELACPGDINFKHGIKADLFSNGSGVSFGGIYHIPVIYNFYFEPGLTFAYNTYGVNIDVIADASETPLKFDEASVRMWQMRVPIIGGYRFDLLDDMSFSVFTGPEINVGLTAKEHYKMDRTTVEEGLYGDDGSFNRFDLKWRFGVGMIYKQHLEFQLSGAVGMLDQFQDSPKMHSNLFDVTIGYNF